MAVNNYWTEREREYTHIYIYMYAPDVLTFFFLICFRIRKRKSAIFRRKSTRTRSCETRRVRCASFWWTETAEHNAKRKSRSIRNTLTTFQRNCTSCRPGPRPIAPARMIWQVQRRPVTRVIVPPIRQTWALLLARAVCLLPKRILPKRSIQI